MDYPSSLPSPPLGVGVGVGVGVGSGVGVGVGVSPPSDEPLSHAVVILAMASVTLRDAERAFVS